jgi:predicted O-linked N-acetylglucosamine transferase (SPINDLY family)
LQKPLPATAKPSQKPECLRIGYFSADFHNHATMHLMAQIFALHDKSRFEILAYSYGPDRQDEMRKKLLGAVDVFHDVREMNDLQIVDLARTEKLDIAIDLKGFTQNERLGPFAYGLAPVQISYLGYPGTLGADFIDYIVADAVVIPGDKRPHYSEQIIYLPNTYQPTDNTRIISDKIITRGDMGLPSDGFVFCCFNNNYKISLKEFDIWMRLLGKVESSVLWLLKSNNWAEQNLKREAEARGISSERLVFAERVPQAEHLARQKLADLFLDTFNVNAHTTTSDALWAGLPVVTKLGEGFAARVAGSLLTAIGLPELITQSEEAYEALALALATDPNELAKIKSKLEANRLTQPLFDSAMYTRHLETGYQMAYDRYFTGNSPDAIIVAA